MSVKIHAHKPGPVSRAFLQVFGLVGDTFDEVADASQADIILLTGSDDLRTLYNEHQLFCVLHVDRHRAIAGNQPENVCILDTLHLFGGKDGIEKLTVAIEKHKVSMANPSVRKSAIVEFPDVATFAKRYSVIVIDDTERNRQIAETVLKDQHAVVVSRLDGAVHAMDHGQFDAVLTDMHMPPDEHYRALNLDRFGIKETVPYGFAVILEATKRGLPVAVVTDGNHHEDWISAMIDRMPEAVVNGQKVLFFNNIGKRWDKALKALLEG